MSQRHRIAEYGSAANGEVHAQGVVATALAVQVDPSNPGVLLPKEGEAGPITIPEGPAGGPLQGSSMTGPVPDAYVPPDPGPAAAPVLTSLTPSSVLITDPDTEVTLAGENFQEGAEVLWDGSPGGSTYVDENTITMTVQPSLFTSAYDLQVSVRNPDQQVSEELTFSFTEGTPAGRTFPAGPYDLALVIRDEAGPRIGYVTPTHQDIRVGDTVTVEATGNTATNGTFVVSAVEGDTYYRAEDIPLAAPIEAKGRITVTDGAV